jgi:hypothetical protein
MQLEICVLTYGRSATPVKPASHLPIPTTFDFDNPEECARLIFACMSNASGGFTLRNCKLRIDREWKMANLTSTGCHVFYAPAERQKRSIEEVIAAEQRQEVFQLGIVRTDQYGDGWKRAQWMAD